MSHTILMLGDSLTEYNEWSDALKRHDILNLGVAGATSTDILRNLASLQKYSKKTVLIMLGINDIIYNHPLQKTQNNYARIIEFLVQHNHTVYIQSTLHISTLNIMHTKVNTSVNMLNTYLQELCQTYKIYNVTYLDVQEHFSKTTYTQELYENDGVHLSQKGYDVWSDYLQANQF